MMRIITLVVKNFFLVVFSLYLKNHFFSQNSLRTISLYSRNDKFVQIFTKIRFWDAPYVELEKLVPKKGTIIDLGCGEGLFSNFLAISSSSRKIVGIDVDTDRINEADKGLANTKFVEGDITKKEIPSAECITIIHVLHHLNSQKQQEDLINDCYKRLKPGGQLLIVEVEPKFSIKYLTTFFTDHFIVPILFERRLYSQIYFRTRKSWEELLTSLNFKVSTKSIEKGMPFTHIIFLAKKR